MSKIDNGGPAFPTVAGQIVYSNGMTLRDWFAGQALAGACATWCENAGRMVNPDAAVAGWAYEIADAMLEARAKEAGK